MKSLRKVKIKDLSAAALHSQPRDIDWAEALGEDREGWHVFSAEECEDCCKLVVVSPWDCCPKCGDQLWNEGPMMNYWYPVEIRDIEQAARAISGLPLCVVEFPDGETGLALTGGGMNFSWEICEAFILLGYLPPFHFIPPAAMAGRGSSPEDKRILSACRRTARTVKSRAGWKIKDLCALGKGVD